MPTITKKQTKDNVLGWKIATIVCAVLAVAGCATAAVLFFSKPKNTDSESDAFADLDSLIKKDDKYEHYVNYYKKDTTKDGKYYYAFLNSGIKDMDGAWGVYTYFRKTEKGAEWQYYTVNNDALSGLPSCSELKGDEAEFINNYGYLDDDLDRTWVDCQK